MTRLSFTMVVAATLVVGAGCASVDGQTADTRAAQLVAEVGGTDLAPELTEELAKSHFGDDGGAVCSMLRDGRASAAAWGRTIVRGAPDEHVTDLVAFDAAVVSVYCPEEQEEFDSLLSDLNVD